jgi:hypothetical protein
MEQTKQINWSVTKEDALLISKIVKRAVKIGIGQGVPMDMHMAITACHLNGTPLKLKELLEADDFNLMHDVCGIQRNINRTTGELENCFLPRFAK